METNTGRKILVTGVQRSGNHCVINWLAQSMKGKVTHHNNIGADFNPYRIRTYKEERTPHNKIFSVEDFNLEYFQQVYAGLETVLILRDPFNLAASLAKREEKYRKRSCLKYRCRTDEKPHKGFNSKSRIDLSRQYMKQALGYIDLIEQPFHIINYNRFVSDENYRERLSTTLEIENHSETLKKQSEKSSFEKTDPCKMDVLNRYKHYINEIWYQKLFDDELIELSMKMFPEIGNPLEK